MPAKSVVISFANQVLPKYIFIFSVRYEVSPFISKTTICFACFRFGHSATQCRAKPRCSHCSRADQDLQMPCPNSPPTCANWKGEHLSTDPKCPELQLLKDVQLLAADENIPLKEAREILTATHPSRSSTLNIMDFPPISSSLETPSGFTFDSPSPPSPLSSPPNSPPLRRVTFAQAVQNNPQIGRAHV